MPKTARFTLTWSAEQDLYGLYEHDHLLLEANSTSWFTWLTTHTSFSFLGRNGHFNLLKETRKNSGEGYWYAYQRQGKRTTKRYVGRSIALFTTRLEEIGRAFQRTQDVETSAWYEREERLTEAIELTLQAQDAEHAAAMIDRYLTGRDFDDMQDHSTLRRWLTQLPDDILSRYPLLCLHYAQILSLSVAPEQPPASMLEQMDTLLQMADTRWRAEGNSARLGEVYAFRAYLTMRQDMQEQAVAYASQALRWLPLESQHWRGVCLNLLGSRALSCKQLTQATVLLQEALTIWTNLHHPHGARSCMLLLATLYGEQGVLHHAAACYRRVIQEARKVGDREDLIPALIGLAQISYKCNDMETAEQVAQEAWDASLASLSRQEQRVLRLLVAELSYSEIARELVVSVNTVKTQISSIYRKLNVHSRQEAQTIAQKLHLLSTESHQQAHIFTI
jgi:ATP/maltotriose-dependent transcriptional regulator MalT